jgi:hypothetical protein
MKGQMRTARLKTVTFRWLFGLLVLCVFPSLSRGIAPAFVSDEELARYPIIVVAKWDKASFRPHHRSATDRTNGEIITAIEAFTELNILRVIKGPGQPGLTTLKIGGGVGWSTNGDWVNSGTSTELPGDVETVAEPNLWFLKISRSWDQSDTTNYVSLDSYRAIQPLVLENYFVVLPTGNPEKEVRALLASTNATAVHRALNYSCDGDWPWPYDSEFTRFIRGPSPERKRVEYADSIEAFLKRDSSAKNRPWALAVYANLTETKSVPFIRSLLRDNDPELRLLAAGLLARQKDTASIPNIIQAMDGKTNVSSAVKIINAIETWGDSRLVPGLANYLETGPTGYEYNGSKTVAFVSREALHRITGHWFPYDTQAALHAWREAQQTADFEERRQLLARILPNDPDPLRAEVLGNGGTNAACKITNKSKQNVTITRFPKWGNQRWPSGLAGAAMGGRPPEGKEDFITLRPGEATQFSVQLQAGFLLAEPAERELTLQYTDTGRDWSMKAWVGTLATGFGAGWTGQRKLEAVVEKWSNGNLKTKGQTMNDEKYGEWEFFNESGDRIRTINYSKGGSAECNPDHPSNKGAGKPLR